MNDQELLRLADLNRTEFWCQSLDWMPGTRIVKDQDLVCIDSAETFPACNVVLPQSADGAHVVERAKSFFSQRKGAFSLLLRSHADHDAIRQCEQGKVLMVSNNAGMVLDQPIKKKSLPEGAELRWAQCAEDVAGFKQVSAEAYQDLGMPPAIGEKYFAQPERVLNPNSILVVAYYKGEPASAAMVLLSDGIAGVYWVGTVKRARGLGLAAYCVQEVGNAAFGRGAPKVILQASQFGDPIYRKMGYREITRYPWFIYSFKHSSI